MPSSSVSELNVPYNLDAERALLGSILLDNSALKLAQESLGQSDFFSEAHRHLFRKMCELAEKGRVIDLVTVSEELGKSGLLEKSGGAAYLAALTDGVPIGTMAGMSEYCRIVREKAIGRQIIANAESAIARAMAGADPGVLAELAKSQAEDIAARIQVSKPVAAEEEEKKKERKPAKERYPKIPATAWHPVAELYRQAVTSASEASDNWHYIAFMTTMGSLLGDSVCGQMGAEFYPNLYSVLVGMVGGDGKSTSVGFCFKFAKMVDSNIYIPRTIDSKAGFIKAWSTYNTQNGIKENTRAILRLGELASLLDTAAQTGTHSIIPMLNDAYDGEPLSNESVTTPYQVEKPRLSAIFASAYKYMHKIDDKDLETGFGRRLCFCPGDAKGPMPYPPPPDKSILIPLAQSVKDILFFWTARENKKLEPSPEALKMWSSWYKKYKHRLRDDDTIAAMSIGDRITCQKLALINAALDKSDRFIEAHHLHPALEFGEYLYQSRFPLFEKHGASIMVEIEEKIMAKIPDPPNKVSKRWLQQNLRTIDSDLFNKRLMSLSAADGPLRMKQIGPKWFIWKAEEGE